MLSPYVGMAAETVTIAVVCEMSGGNRAPTGKNWERGVLMAVEEMNAAGGILGKKIETFTLDTKTEDPCFCCGNEEGGGKEIPLLLWEQFSAVPQSSICLFYNRPEYLNLRPLSTTDNKKRKPQYL